MAAGPTVPPVQNDRALNQLKNIESCAKSLIIGREHQLKELNNQAVSINERERRVFEREREIAEREKRVARLEKLVMVAHEGIKNGKEGVTLSDKATQTHTVYETREKCITGRHPQHMLQGPQVKLEHVLSLTPMAGIKRQRLDDSE